ncbi:hypothetical protein [Bacillus sp. FJAT-29937]|uniref:hypothetical protein n=1 Tax=Bacillus sp. FJAT-29937 TaxID=1720553 RepID=UPI0008309C54|nr:hypothetical protein [Bacillus sp. FJAT-29937]
MVTVSLEDIDQALKAKSISKEHLISHFQNIFISTGVDDFFIHYQIEALEAAFEESKSKDLRSILLKVLEITSQDINSIGLRNLATILIK